MINLYKKGLNLCYYFKNFAKIVSQGTGPVIYFFLHFCTLICVKDVTCTLSTGFFEYFLLKGDTLKIDAGILRMLRKPVTKPQDYQRYEY